MSFFSDILNRVESIGANVDWADLLKVAAAAEAALPAIEQGIVNGAPYVQAIIAVLSGKTVTPDEWAALNARLDAGSAALDKAAAPDPGGSTT